MAHRVTLIPGDGTGPELTEATRRVLEATGVEFDWDVQPAGEEAMHEHGGNPLPDGTLESIRTNGVALKGPITTPVGGGFRSVNVGLRKALDMYAQVRPCKSYPGVRSRFEDVDLVIVRENTEDLYAGIEYEQGTPDAEELISWIESKGGSLRWRDAGISIKPISVTGTRRIFEFAFDHARRMGRRKVTAVHKANIMKTTDGLFLQVAREVAARHPEIEFEEAIIDALCLRLVQSPRSFDVLVLPNLYGDIVSDLCAAFVGGLGVAPGANLGHDAALFEPVHGSAPQFKGSGIMNPTALLLSGAMMLRHVGEKEAGDRLERAISAVLAAGRVVTPDLLPADQRTRGATTEQMADAIVQALEN
jgi:isocitrate dehydrogenase (NAD+)